ADHLLRLVADGEHFPTVYALGDHRRFAQHDPFSLDVDQRVGGAEVNAHVSSEPAEQPVENHESTLLSSSGAAPRRAPRCGRLANEPPQTTMWSMIGMPIPRPARLSLSVIAKSARLGVGSPDGWLWTRIPPAAPRRTAALNTSRGWTGELARPPLEISMRSSTSFLVLSSSTQ